MNLIEYAKEHRYRLCDLHRGGPVPPAMWRRPKGWPRNKRGDEFWAIVGRRGMLTDTGRGGWIEVTLFYRNKFGVKNAKAKLCLVHGQITQDGDTEVAAMLPDSEIETALQLIKVSCRRLGPAAGPQVRVKYHGTEAAKGPNANANA